MDLFSKKIVSNIALGTASLCLLLMAIRAYFSISFHIPLQLMTSGAEYESLFAIWKHVNELTVYADHTRIPFAGSFYNWLYYYFYGEATGIILKLFSLDDAWLPTITRLITITGAIYGAWITRKLFYSFLPNSSNFLRNLGLSLAILIFLGPLMGFFGIATQPDIWGFALDVTAVYFFLRFYEKRPLLAVIIFCLFAYLAWGFKQILVFSTGAVGLFLFLRGDWRMLFALTCLSFVGWSATLGLGTPQYIKTIISFGGSTVAFDSTQLIRNLSNLSIKIIPILLGLLCVLVTIIFNKKLKIFLVEVNHSLRKKGSKPHIGLFFTGCFVTSIIAIPASAKLGSAENYYFLLSFFLSSLFLYIMFWVEKMIDWPDIISWPLSLGWMLQGLALCLVLVGAAGVISKRPAHERNYQTSKCLANKDMRQPIFIASQYLSLPWMVPAEQHFVIQTNYRWDKPRGIKMEGGGIGGLIDKGYFASIAMIGNTYDGSNLQHYRKRNEKCGAYAIFDRINSNGK
jgi:hypothetical protein